MTPGTTLPDSAPQPVNERQQAVDQLNDLAWSLHDSDPQRSEASARQAHRLAAEGDPPYSYGLAYSLLILSILAWDQARYEVALDHALEAMRLFEEVGDQGKLAYTLNHIAAIHYFLGNSSPALELGVRAVQLAEKSGDQGLLASLLNDTGYMLLHLSGPQAALPQLLRSLEMHRAAGSARGEAQALDSIGKAYLLLGDTGQALAFEQQSLALVRAIGYKRAEADALGNIGRIFTAAADFDQALHHFEQSLALCRERGYRQFEAGNLLEIGRVYLRRLDFARALDSLHQARELAEAIGATPLLTDIHAALAEAHEQSGDLRASLTHSKQFYRLKETAGAELIAARMHSLQAMHEAEAARQQAEIYRQHNIALQQQIEEHERLIAELDAFAHTVAHDLKSPLAVIAGLSELILEQLVAAGNESTAALERDQLRMAYKLAHIVDELLLLAQVRREDVSLALLDMGAIVAEVRERLAQQIATYGAELVCPASWPPALGYGPWIEEVWANYISNAIKYGGEPPRVELGAAPEGSQVRFWVRDNGPGLDTADPKALFAEFSRLTSLTGKRDGHGLGLSIVKRIVEKLGGTVGVETVPGQGSTFSFTLPAPPGPA